MTYPVINIAGFPSKCQGIFPVYSRWVAAWQCGHIYGLKNFTLDGSTDNASWTTRTTASGGSGYLKAAVGAAVRYVTIDHPSSVSQTSYEIEAITKRCPRPMGMAFNVRNHSSRFALSTFAVRNYSARKAGAVFSVRQHSSRFTNGNYRIRQLAPIHALSAYHIFPPVPAWFDEGGASLESIITGLLKTGAVSTVVPLRLWNAHGGVIALKMVNVKITVALDNCGYSGGTYPQGQEAVNGKWVELKSSGIIGTGITDDSQSAFTPIGGPPASGALSIGDIPANSARIIFLRLNLPASPSTPFAATPHVLVSYDVIE